MEEEVQKSKSEAKIYLENVAQPLRDSGLMVDCITIEGLSIGEAIVDYARANDVDLIAIATHGRSGIKRMVFGSVADFLVKESGLPVLALKPQESTAIEDCK
jgi:nucleotide-binding universal stress UspA family protein